MLNKKTILLFIVLLSAGTFAQSAWGEEVFLDVQEKSLRFVLNEIIDQTNLNLIFDDNQTSKHLLTYSKQSTAESVISELLSKNGFSYKKFSINSAVIYKDKLSSPKRKAVVRKSKPELNKNKVSPNISRPILLSKHKPEYPTAAMRDRLEGEVLTKILVSSKGDVIEVKLERSSGFDILDTATINYIRKLKFLAAEYNGKYQDSWTSMLVKYNFE